MIAASLIGVMVGMFIGKYFRDDETCPRAVLGYTCKGDTCDHTKSELYRCKMQMALADEEREASKNNNYWGGPNA